MKKLETGNVVLMKNGTYYLLDSSGSMVELNRGCSTSIDANWINEHVDLVDKVFEDFTLKNVIWINENVSLNDFEKEFLKNINKKFKYLIKARDNILLSDKKEKLVFEDELTGTLAFMLALDDNTNVIDISVFKEGFLKTLKENQKYEIANLVE